MDLLCVSVAWSGMEELMANELRTFCSDIGCAEHLCNEPSVAEVFEWLQERGAVKRETLGLRKYKERWVTPWKEIDDASA